MIIGYATIVGSCIVSYAIYKALKAYANRRGQGYLYQMFQNDEVESI